MTVTVEDLKALFHDLAEVMDAERDRLCALDGVIGDADHGIAMSRGMRAAAAAADEVDDTLQGVFTAAAKAFLNAVGGSSGPLIATALLRAGKVAGTDHDMPRDRLRDVIAAMAHGIAERGKAEPGQKTMLDAWHPAAIAAQGGATPAGIAAAADEGAQATRNMVATVGRAAKLGERSLGHPDPGAVSAALMVAKIVDFLAVADRGTA